MPKAEGGASLRALAIESARGMFLRWGYAGASIAMIAGELGVTKAALYYHFPDKEALFLAVFDEYLSLVAADLAALADRFGGRAPARDSFEALAAVFLSRGRSSAAMERLAFQESPHLSEKGRTDLAERYHRNLVRPLGEYFARAQESGWIRPPREGEPARVWLFMGLLSAFFAPGHEAEGPGGRDTGITDQSAAAFAHALLEGIASA